MPFLPAVLYSKDSASEQEKYGSMERTKILKGDHLLSGEEVYAKDGTAVRAVTQVNYY